MDNETTGHGNLESILQDPSAKPRVLRLQELKEITNNFSKDRQLGKGGFGVVYKGLLPNGEAVAVKDLILSQFQVQEKQFKREVDNLMKVQHKNIVRFLGYCYESSHQYIEYEATHVFAESSQMLLCFEYVPNGSLDKHINDESCGFDWHKRYRIIKGICHGLHYLHEECRPDGSVVHLDLKPENILLHDNMVPKIADFGISKLFSDRKLETCATVARGSLGYMAPEYISGKVVSKKADIYSLGVIIIQIITGRRVDVTSCKDIVEPVLENWSKRMEAKTSITDCEQIRMCLKIGIQCLEFVKENRPSIKEIRQMLYTWEVNNGYASDKERCKLMECNNMREKESHCNNKEATIEEIVEEKILMGDAYDNRNGFTDEEMRRSVNEKLLGGATENELETNNLALDEILEALHKDEKSVVSMLDRDRVSAIVRLLNERWPKTVQEKAATVVCHVARSCEDVLLLKLEDAVLPLVRLAESGSFVGRQKAVVTLHHLSSKSDTTAFFIVSDGGVRPLIEMCCLKGGDSVCQSAAAGTLRNISAAPDLQQSLANHGIVRVMVGLLGRGDAVPESKEHAVQCLEQLTNDTNDSSLRWAVVSEGALRALLLYLGENDDRHEAAVRAIRNLVDVISTSSSAGDTTTTMKCMAGEQGCVPLLVSTIQEGNSRSAREVAVLMLAQLATYPPNASEMIADDKCVPGLVQLIEPTQDITAITHAIQCLLLLVSTNESCRNLMISHGAKRHLRKLSDLDVPGAAELLHSLKRSWLRSLFSNSETT